MPNRIIKESICTSDTIDSLDWFDEVFFYRLTVNVDDYGRLDARPAILRSRLFPLKADVTDAAVEDALGRLEVVGLVSVYTVDGKPYLFLPTWERHQTIRNHKSKYPAPDSNCMQLKSIEINCKQLQANVPVIQSVSNPNPNPDPNPNPEGEEAAKPPMKKSVRFVPPGVDEVRAYCQERANKVNAEQFVDFYTAKGWRIGKDGMRDWQAAVRTWEQNAKSGAASARVKSTGFHAYDQDGSVPDTAGPDLLAEARASHG